MIKIIFIAGAIFMLFAVWQYDHAYANTMLNKGEQLMVLAIIVGCVKWLVITFWSE